ncbi:MAG: hypothetical protein K9H41_08580 [Bacteroidia bacterium]|nr:hypothetical protein [Bacteroidia bacterium]
MKKILNFVGIFLSLLFFTTCKKLEPVAPSEKNGIKIFNFFTDYNQIYDNEVNWIRKPSDEVWTWSPKGFYKAFDSEQNLRDFNIPYATLSPGYSPLPNNNNYNLNTQNIFCLNFNGNIEHAYLDTINDLSGTSPTKLYLCKNEINQNGNIINQDSVFVNFIYAPFYLNSFKFTKTSNNYYFAFESYFNNYNEDTLYLLKTDLNLHIQSRYKKTRSYTSSYYFDPRVMDIQANGNTVCMTYEVENAYNYYKRTAFDIFDSNLNFIKKVRADSIITMPASARDDAFKKVLIRNNKVFVFGEMEPDYYSSLGKKIYMSVFDLNGNLLVSKALNTKRTYPYLRGIEPTNDGKFIIYYDESDGGSFDKIGICKMDEFGNVDYSIMFPETDDSSYNSLIVYEGSDGKINVYGYRYFNNFIGLQTFFAKINKDGKIQ